MQKLTTGWLDDAALDAAKASAKVKNLHEVITVDEEGQQHATYFKKPELKHLELVAKMAKEGKASEGLEILFNTCWVAGSEAVKTDEEMKAAANKELAQIFKVRETQVKKR